MKTIIIFAILSIILTACSVSFQNLDTHGHPSDVVDDTQATHTELSPKMAKSHKERHKKKQKDSEDKFINHQMV